MSHWTDELHVILLKITGLMNRPDIDARFLERTGLKLDRALFPLLARIGVAGPIGAVDLAAMVGRDHSTVSRQLAKLEDLGLLERTPSSTDGRVRLLKPSAAGRRMLAMFAKTRRKLLEELLRDWNAHERAQLLRLLTNLSASIDNILATGDQH